MEPFTPKVLYDLYASLAADQQNEFLKILAQNSTPKLPLVLMSYLPKAQHIELVQRVFGHLVEKLWPIMAKQILEVLRAHPDVKGEDLTQKAVESFKNWGELATKVIAQNETEKIKRKRDRKSDPEVVKRNAKICEQRRSNPRKWTLGQLMLEYGFSKSTIQSILRKEAKWKELMNGYGN